jgi:uncharacterized membrane protein YeaQ/YmgE (transglycosylase-associated protein family)
MSNYIISVIRTWVPIIIGGFFGWLVTKGINVDHSSLVYHAMIDSIVGSCMALYYAVVRWLELKVSPKFGWLFGIPSMPKYPDSK